jgi:hypothetical protein
MRDTIQTKIEEIISEDRPPFLEIRTEVDGAVFITRLMNDEDLPKGKFKLRCLSSHFNRISQELDKL